MILVAIVVPTHSADEAVSFLLLFFGAFAGSLFGGLRLIRGMGYCLLRPGEVPPLVQNTSAPESSRATDHRPLTTDH